MDVISNFVNIKNIYFIFDLSTLNQNYSGKQRKFFLGHILYTKTGIHIKFISRDIQCNYTVYCNH